MFPAFANVFSGDVDPMSDWTCRFLVKKGTKQLSEKEIQVSRCQKRRRAERSKWRRIREGGFSIIAQQQNSAENVRHVKQTKQMN